MVKNLAWLFGVAISLLLFGYFAWFAVGAFANKDFVRLVDPLPAASMLVAAGLSCAVVLVSAWVWRRLLADTGEEWALRPLFGVLAITVLGKYVPGNVAQHLGRIGYARILGMAPAVAVFTILLETVLLLGAGLLVALVLLPIGDGTSAPRSVPLAPLLGLAAGLVVLGFVLARAVPKLLAVAKRFDWLQGRIRLDLQVPRPATWAVALLGYATCYFLLGAGLWLIAVSLSVDFLASFLYLTASFALAWLLGFLAPGVPAGLGAREGMLLMFLQGSAPDDVILTIILASRAASVLGDLLCFAIGLVISPGLRAKIPA